MFSVDIPPKEKSHLKVIVGYKDDFFYKTYTTYEIFKSKTFSFEDFYFDIVKAKGVNEMIVTVEKVVIGDGKEISVTVMCNYYNNVQSMYFNKNEVYQHFGFIGKKYVFFTKVYNDDIGEIAITMKNGGGKVTAKVKQSEQTNELEYEEFHSKIKIKENDIKICDKGCELYFIIEDNEKDKNVLYTPADFKFSFYYRTNSIVVLPSNYFNEYIKGSLNKANEYDYYSFTVPMNTERIVFTLKSHFTELVINLLDEGKPTLHNKKWHMKSTEHQLIINSSEIGLDSLMNKTFIIGAVIPSLYDSLYSNYKFRISPQYRNTSTLLPLSFEEAETCETKIANQYCYYILSKDKYRPFIAINTLTDDTSSPLIVDLTKERKYFDEYDYSNRIQSLLPTKEYYYNKSETVFISHTVSSELYSENYLLIGIFNDEPKTVTVMLLGNDNTTVHYPTSNMSNSIRYMKAKRY